MQKFEGEIPIIIVYTRMISKSNFNKMKEQINNKIKDATLIPILAEAVINDDEDSYNTIKSFGLDNLKNKTLELVKKKGNIFNILKNKSSEYIKENIYNENNTFEEETKSKIVNSFISNFRETKSENDFLSYIVKLLGINFRKNDEQGNNISNYIINILKEMEILFNDVKNIIKIVKINVREYIDSIIEMKSMNFLNAQATIEKVRQKSISNTLKKDKEQFKNIINAFLNLIQNESEQYFQNLYIKKMEDFENKFHNNKNSVDIVDNNIFTCYKNINDNKSEVISNEINCIKNETYNIISDKSSIINYDIDYNEDIEDNNDDEDNEDDND